MQSLKYGPRSLQCLQLGSCAAQKNSTHLILPARSPPPPLPTTQKAGCYKAAGGNENQLLGWRRQQQKEEEEEEEEEEATLLQVFISRRGEEGDPILVKVCSKAQVVTAKEEEERFFLHKFNVFVARGECGLGPENNRHFCPFRLGIGRDLESNESGMMTLFFFRNNLPGKVNISGTCSKMIHIFSRFWSPCSIRHTFSLSSLIFFNGRFFFFFSWVPEIVC